MNLQIFAIAETRSFSHRASSLKAQPWLCCPGSVLIRGAVLGGLGSWDLKIFELWSCCGSRSEEQHHSDIFLCAFTWDGYPTQNSVSFSVAFLFQQLGNSLGIPEQILLLWPQFSTHQDVLGISQWQKSVELTELWDMRIFSGSNGISCGYSGTTMGEQWDHHINWIDSLISLEPVPACWIHLW